jgi:hypothetical protein
MRRNPTARIALIVVLAASAPAFAQGVAPAASQPEAQRPTGLPAGMSWTFNLDAGFGGFSFFNALFTNPRDEPSGDLGDNWFEGFAKPALAGAYTFDGGAVIDGAVSVVGERTYGGAPILVGEDFSSFAPEDLQIGWRSGTAWTALGDDALSFTVGRARYQLGHGFLLYDGAGEGGSRGGYWTNARKAFELASILRFAPGPHTAEAFYLDKDELPEAETGSRLWGANYEVRIGEHTSLGAAYMRLFADAGIAPGRDGLRVFNARAYAAPVPAHDAFTLEAEYAREDTPDILTSNAWSLQGTYAFDDAWTPKLSYRYAFFEGDDPSTPRSEAFDPLFLGFSDWGTWWQGEIAGEYFLANSNLKSHQGRLHLAPHDRVGIGAIVYRFLAHRPATFGSGVTSDDVAWEVDGYTDWKLNETFTLSLVSAWATPGDALRQNSGRTKPLGLGMLYLAYSY